ncbi:T9SS type A sorting domain-containing protein [Membranicola marinus]|uniref:T9SS type A sorting domain-containing protein n=1 Tax=Membranihabitans marinus TaxID=1227546 RepID=A0A953HJ08_9BACT|nr:T9SS type A sorting domain-containing protein [Membranihabitans marinus]
MAAGGGAPQHLSLNIYSSSGKRMWSQSLDQVGPSRTVHCTIPNLNSGTYFYHIRSKNGYYTSGQCMIN